MPPVAKTRIPILDATIKLPDTVSAAVFLRATDTPISRDPALTIFLSVANLFISPKVQPTVTSPSTMARVAG